MNLKRKTFFIVPLLLLCLCMPGTTYADTHIKGPISEKEAMKIILGGFMEGSPGGSNQFADIGSYDVWLHADGVTWQKGIKPGSAVSVDFIVPLGISSKNYDKVKDVSVEFLNKKYDKYNQQYYRYGVTTGTIENSRYLGNGKVSFTMKTVLIDNSGLGGFDITRQNQLELVQGKRFYLPVKISYSLEGEGSSGVITWELGNPDSYEIDMYLYD